MPSLSLSTSLANWSLLNSFTNKWILISIAVVVQQLCNACLHSVTHPSASGFKTSPSGMTITLLFYWRCPVMPARKAIKVNSELRGKGLCSSRHTHNHLDACRMGLSPPPLYHPLLPLSSPSPVFPPKTPPPPGEFLHNAGEVHDDRYPEMYFFLKLLIS